MDGRYRQGYYGRPQGGGFYDPYQKGPAWGQGIKELLKNMMMLKQMKEKEKYERGEKEREWEFEEAEQARKFERWGAQEDLWKAQAERISRPPEPPVEKRSTIYQESLDLVKSGLYPDVGAALSARLKQKEEPTDAYSKLKRDLDEEVRIGTMTHAERNQALFKLKQGLTPDELRRKGASIRDGNMREIRDFFKTIPGLIDNKGRMVPRKLRKIVGRQEGGLPLSSQGYRLDMPERYNRAILNKRDGVATVENIDVIAKYDAMFSVFRDRLMGRGIDSFKKYMTLPDTRDLRDDPSFDNSQIKLWYEIFKK